MAITINRMTQEARVVIELDEFLDDDLDDVTIAGMGYDEFDDRSEFAEFVWETRMKEMGFGDRLRNVKVYKIDE